VARDGVCVAGGDLMKEVWCGGGCGE
jgi:hypothetical protein